MRSIPRSLAWLTFTTVTMAGCADERPAVEPATPQLDIAGRWQGDCFDQGDGTFGQLEFDITPSRWTLDYVVHGNDACEVPLATVRIEGPYAVEEPSTVVDGAYDARFGFDTKTITPHVPNLVAALDEAGCGAAAWTVDGAQSVAETGCAAFGQYPIADCPADYDLVLRDGDQLRFGQRPRDNRMCTPAARPSALGATVTRMP